MTAGLADRSAELVAWTAELRDWCLELQAQRAFLSGETALLWWRQQTYQGGFLDAVVDRRSRAASAALRLVRGSEPAAGRPSLISAL